MDIRIYNSLTKKTETFKPIKEGRVGIYNCGPTVYDTPHIGNYRSFVTYDLVRRMFEYNGYKVEQVMNITDVDDKTIKRSRREGVPLAEVTRKYEDLFVKGLASLNVLTPHHLIRATDHIGNMIDLISRLIENGSAYKADDGIYMSIDKVKGYGELAGIEFRSKTKERVANDEYDKDDPRDFALWKFKTSDDGDVSWSAPFGEGRPGWHIECSAMAMKVLGPTIDVHIGAADLIFPHHTNEIAQSESATGVKFSRYWMHGGLMTIRDSKMSKSKGNVTKLEDLAAGSISPIAFRYWLLTSNYRSPVSFTYEAVHAAQNALIRLMGTVSSYLASGSVGNADQKYISRFNEFINDDLDMPKAVALVWELVGDKSVSDSDKLATLLDFDKVFGLGLRDVPPEDTGAGSQNIPAEILALADAREEARKEKDWMKADALRVEIEKRGYAVKDTPEGVRISEARENIIP